MEWGRESVGAKHREVLVWSWILSATPWPKMLQMQWSWLTTQDCQLSLYSVQIEKDQAFSSMNLGEENLQVRKYMTCWFFLLSVPPQRMEASLLTWDCESWKKRCTDFYCFAYLFGNWTHSKYYLLTDPLLIPVTGSVRLDVTGCHQMFRLQPIEFREKIMDVPTEFEPTWPQIFATSWKMNPMTFVSGTEMKSPGIW